MSGLFANVLPVLRTPSVARSQLDVFHVEIPAERDGAVPWCAFTTGSGLLSRADVLASGIASKSLYSTALENLAARRGAWKVEQAMGGFLGLGKKPVVMAMAHEFAAEHILLRDVIDQADKQLAKAIVFAPRRGYLRAVASETEHYARERDAAKQAFEAAGADAVMPVELSRMFVVGNTFHMGKRFTGEAGPYVPPIENVTAMVINKQSFRYRPGASACPNEKLVGDLVLMVGVVDDNGARTTLPAAALDALGISFDKAIGKGEMIAKLPILPITEFGTLPSSGQPVYGFKGKFAIEQLALRASLERLHERLGDPYQIAIIGNGLVAATKLAKNTPAGHLDLAELCDPRQPGVIMTRGTPEAFGFFITSRGKPTSFAQVQLER